jgi:chemotaxis protein MotA
VDLTTLAGLVLGWACVVAGILMTPNANLGLFLDLPSVMIVVGGTAGALLMGFRGADLRSLGRVLRLAFFQPLPSASKIIADFRRYADIARRDGILALEKVTGEISDPFLLAGMQHAIDGLDPDVIQQLMRTELEYMGGRHERGIRLLRQAGQYAPAFGMVGTLIGLVVMLANLKEPGAIGPAMAVAIITTFYGASIAYLVALPLADKLALKHGEEMILREMMVKGLASIQSGDSPRVVEQKLKVLLPPRMRTAGPGREAGR